MLGIVVIVVLISAVFLLLWSALHTYLKLRGRRLVTCPETREPAAVEINATHSLFIGAIADRALRLKDCNRWPDRKACGQECLSQIESSPEDCLVQTILTNWYKGKKCAFCGKTFSKITWLDHKPALMSPSEPTVEWSEISPETIPVVLATAKPVCWNCHIAEAFRRRYPELVVDRPWRSGDSHRKAESFWKETPWNL